MGLNQPAVAPDQRLNTERFRRAENAVPPGGMAAVVSGGGHQYRAAARVNALQQGGEIFAADLAGQAEADGALADPFTNAGLTLGVIVVLTIVLLEIAFGLSAIERARRHA